MQNNKGIQLRVRPNVAENEALLKLELAEHLNINVSDLPKFYIHKKSIDARQALAFINVTVKLGERKEDDNALKSKKIGKTKKHVVIVGCGPAGLFAALALLERGIKPILIERGKNVRDRRRDLAKINKEHSVNPNSNYCFGEGGAGTYSDGKLYTRSKKRGDVMKVLQTLVNFGAPTPILVDAHPHIGTNKLPQIISSISKHILDMGGEIKFNTTLTDIEIENGSVKSVIVNENECITTEHVILATGHSARDIYTLLDSKNLALEAKNFALGVRAEHPQELINTIQYKKDANNEFLPPASYKLVQQVRNTGVYSFCMCPGGIIAPCATNNGEVVTNGWSPSKRNNPFANSGIVVEVDVTKLPFEKGKKHFAGLNFQQEIEKLACKIAGNNQTAPAQRMVDFCNNVQSKNLADCSYIPGVESVNLNAILPSFIHNPLIDAFKLFGKKMHGYYTNSAMLVGVESRTSTPVRIPREDSLQHPQAKGLYPCGEGAGYAGGIVSAAMDGVKCAMAIDL